MNIILEMRFDMIFIKAITSDYDDADDDVDVSRASPISKT